MPLSLNEIRNHWQNWAVTYGTDLRATTKTSTAKLLELDALERVAKSLAQSHRGAPMRILEAGCGNGYNCIHLAQKLPDSQLCGFDYIPEMVAAACKLRDDQGIPSQRLQLLEANVVDPPKYLGLFDLVFTVRCLINLNSFELQSEAMRRLGEHVAPGGAMVLIENSLETYGRQNRARSLAGLEARTPAAFNLFLDDKLVMPHLGRLGFDVRIEDFSSLHDLILYVLLPLTNGGKIDYEHPLVESAASLSCLLNQDFPGSLGSYGQNRMYVCRRR